MSSSFAHVLTSETTPKDTALGAESLDRHLKDMETSLMRTRNQVVGYFDRELAKLRRFRTAREGGSPKAAEQAVAAALMQEAPLPSNVVAVGRDVFASKEMPPVEARLDPDLERATVEELNAALEAAFFHVSEH